MFYLPGRKNYSYSLIKNEKGKNSLSIDKNGDYIKNGWLSVLIYVTVAILLIVFTSYSGELNDQFHKFLLKNGVSDPNKIDLNYLPWIINAAVINLEIVFLLLYFKKVKKNIVPILVSNLASLLSIGLFVNLIVVFNWWDPYASSGLVGQQPENIINLYESWSADSKLFYAEYQVSMVILIMTGILCVSSVMVSCTAMWNFYKLKKEEKFMKKIMKS